MPRKSVNAVENTATKLVKKIPATETGHGVIYHTLSGKEYRITQNPIKQMHTLWKVVDGGFEKIAVDASPNNLYPLIEE